MGLFVRNLADVLKTEGEEFVRNLIDSFSCKYNAADGKLITGEQLLDLAKGELRIAKKQVGGQVFFIEKEQGNAKLDEFYKRNGFVQFDSRVSEEDNVTYDLMFSFLK